MGGHHLILGELVDFLTGKTVVDTHDERYRQKIARFLVHKKGYGKEQIEPARPLVVVAGERRGQINVDFTISLEKRIAMVIKYGPGSLVTRHRPALAVSRLLENYYVPIVVVTNGEDAHVLEGVKGNLLSEGFESIPSYEQLLSVVGEDSFQKITRQRAQMEARIVYCFEIDGSCPCDDTVCRLE